MIKSAFDILNEASAADSFEVDDIFDDDIEAQFTDIYSDDEFEDFDDDICCHAEAVRIYNYNEGYVVECDEVIKFMTSNNIDDIEEAFTMIAEANEIDKDKISILIESDDYASELIEEAKSMKKSNAKKKKLGVMQKASEFLKNVKNKGIRVLKKKKK